MPTSTSDARAPGAGPDPARLKADLAAAARAEGFAAMGVCDPGAVPEAAGRLAAFLDAGRHGDMGWMEERAGWRADPRVLWPEARAVVMLADSYAPEVDPMATLDDPEAATISVYARRRDYHDPIKKRLKRLARGLIAAGGGEVKVFVDTAPVMEKPLAAAAGLGWQGKHTNLLGRGFGNWVFLGAIFTTLPLPPDAAEGEHCGTCRRCLEICPTAAFPRPFELDARRCISYLTIELKGPIPRAFRPLIGNRIYGCDDCLAVCPWNKFAVRASEALSRGGGAGAVEAPRLAELAALDDAAFREAFRGSPVKRIGRARFLRNVLTAIGNSGRTGLAEVAEARLDDAEPLVRGAAVWALGRLDPAALRARAASGAADPDATVRGEWAASLAEAGA